MPSAGSGWLTLMELKWNRPRPSSRDQGNWDWANYGSRTVGECPEWIALQVKLRAHIGAESCPLGHCGSVLLPLKFWNPGMRGTWDVDFLSNPIRLRGTLKDQAPLFHFNSRQSHHSSLLPNPSNTASPSRALSPNSTSRQLVFRLPPTIPYPNTSSSQP